MTIAYCTNVWNHHQGPVCRSLARLLGGDFKMLLHQPLDHEYSKARFRMGWSIVPPSEPWIIGPPEKCEDVDYSQHLYYARNVDVLVFNSGIPYITQELLLTRHRSGMINFRMGERLYKEALPRYYLIWPRKIFARWLVRHRFESAHIHYLTMGHGCREDLRYLHACKGRIWRWGYFTHVSQNCPVRKYSGVVRIGWCGRMIDWKQVDLILRAFALLPLKVQNRCELTLVGNGDQESRLKQLSLDLGISRRVFFCDQVSSSDALKFMRQQDIYVFPSNRKEGWGAALLEAMDSGCAVVANEAAGATLEVVQKFSGFESLQSGGLPNGLTFKDGDIHMLAKQLEWLVEHRTERINMGISAWRTVQNWSPETAANRLIQLAQALKEGVPGLIPSDGICAAID